MNLTLTRLDTQEIIEFPEDLRWIDEHDWSAVAQTTPQVNATNLYWQRVF